MKFVVNGVKYEFDDKKLTFIEARDVQKVTKRPFGQVMDSMGQGDFESIQAMIWVAMRRDDKSLRFSDLDDLELGEFELTPDPEDEEEQADPPVLGDESEETLTPSE